VTRVSTSLSEGIPPRDAFDAPIRSITSLWDKGPYKTYDFRAVFDLSLLF